MVFGPIFRVELVTVARRRRYFLLRVAYGALALFILWTSYSSSNLAIYGTSETTSIQASQRLATGFFNAFTWMQMLAILVVGPAMAAGTIASERESRTIEYLFATDLSNSEIVLGKTIARLCLLGQFVLVCLPILFIFRMLGGIGAQLLLCTFLLAAGTAFFVTALGVCVSVWSPKSRDATVRTYGILLAVLILPTVIEFIASILSRYYGGTLWNEYGVPAIYYVKLINPISLLGAATWGGQLELAMILPTLLAHLLLGAALLLLAVAAVRRVHLSETTRTAKSVFEWKRQPAIKQHRPIGDRPMVWKEMVSGSSATRTSLAGRIALGLILGLLLASSAITFFEALTSGSTMNRSIYLQLLYSQTIMIGLGMLLLLAVNASGAISNERERDCWLSLISTPLTGKEIVQGKTLGNLYSMRWPALLIAFTWMLGVFLDPAQLWSAVAVCATLLLLAWYVTNLGIYFSLRSQTTMRSMGATLAIACFFGGGYLMCCCPLMAASGGDEGMVILLAPCIPALLSFSVFAFTEDMSRGGMETAMPVAYCLGLLIYFFAGVGLYSMATNDFDSLAGRCDTVPDGQKQ